MKPLAKVGVGCAAVAVVASVGLALVLPRLLPEVRRVVGPIRDVQRAQRALDDMVDETAWKRPERDVLTAEQLDRFFAVRERMEAVRRDAGPTLDKLPRKRVGSLEELREVPQIIHDVTGFVGAEMEALVAARMPPAEYHWIERLVYERWRGALKRAGEYPAALHAAAQEIAAAAAGESDSRVRLRLERLAAEMRARKPEPPAGFDPSTHELLLERLDQVERWSLDDLAPPYIPMPR